MEKNIELEKDLMEFEYGVNKYKLCDFLNSRSIRQIAEYLTEQGYRKQVEAEWDYHEAILTDDGFICVYACSNCNACVYEEDFHQDYFHKNYCGHCGAKMKGE